MTLLSDKWIKDQAEQNQMIVPFLDHSVKLSDDGTRKIPSKGLSSYGYDVSLGRNFTVFKSSKTSTCWKTSTGETFLDGLGRPQPFASMTEVPRFDKNCIDICDFNPNVAVEFVDLDWIIMPPHSFMLAHTVEKITMPRDVSAVCMGKSTIARFGLLVTVTPIEANWCFTGDTEVALANGTSVNFKDMVERANNGERFFGYTIRKDGSVGIEELLNPRKTRENTELVEVILDDDEIIRCTPDHLFLTKKDGYVKAIDLKENQSLMALYRYYDKKGYESIASPVYNKTRPIYTHKLSDQWNIENNVYPYISDMVRHHVDFVNNNNYPTNVVRMSDEEHHRVHETKPGYTEERKKIGKLGWAGLLRKFSKIGKNTGMNISEVVSEYCSRASKKFWEDDKHSEKRAEWLEKHKGPCINRRSYFNEKDLWHGFLTLGSVRAVAKTLKTKGETIIRNHPALVAKARFDGIIPTNHKVKSVKRLDYKEDVYCLTVPNTANFALEAGVFVHNCGFITLEIANLTNVPIKMWSGIGITQLLFQPGNEPPMVSYSDRNGKYNNQPSKPVMATN